MNICNENTRLNSCPYCKENTVIKYGKSNGIQRYKCKNETCKRTFLQNHSYVFKNSKKFKYMWKDYFMLIIDGATIRECAVKLNISIVTSFMWRHKILDSIKTENKVEILRSYVELTKLIYKENFKGSRYISTNERGRINIVSAIDRELNIRAFPISRSSFGMKHLNKIVFPAIDIKAYTVGYQDRRLELKANTHNKENKNIKENNDEIDKFFSVKEINWFKKFYGVATKFIDHYLEWYNYIYKIDECRCEVSLDIYNYIRWKDIRNKSINIEM